MIILPGKLLLLSSISLLGIRNQNYHPIQEYCLSCDILTSKCSSLWDQFTPSVLCFSPWNKTIFPYEGWLKTKLKGSAFFAPCFLKQCILRAMGTVLSLLLFSASLILTAWCSPLLVLVLASSLKLQLLRLLSLSLCFSFLSSRGVVEPPTSPKLFLTIVDYLAWEWSNCFLKEIFLVHGTFYSVLDSVLSLDVIDLFFFSFFQSSYSLLKALIYGQSQFNSRGKYTF